MTLTPALKTLSAEPGIDDEDALHMEEAVESAVQVCWCNDCVWLPVAPLHQCCCHVKVLAGRLQRIAEFGKGPKKSFMTRNLCWYLFWQQKCSMPVSE